MCSRARLVPELGVQDRPRPREAREAPVQKRPLSPRGRRLQGTLLNGRPRPPQAQVSAFQRENEALRSGQGASLAVVRQNTDAALQNLRLVMNSAHTSIK